jgi:hypothetical protein
MSSAGSLLILSPAIQTAVRFEDDIVTTCGPPDVTGWFGMLRGRERCVANIFQFWCTR